MEPKLPSNGLCQREATDDLDRIYLNGQSFKGRVTRHFFGQFSDRVWSLKENHRKIDGDVDRAAVGDKIAPISNRLINNELRQRTELRVTVIGYKIAWCDNPPSRMTHANERLSTGNGKRARIDLRLVPKFEPPSGDRFPDIYRGQRRGFDRQQRGDTVAQIRVAKGSR